MARIVYSVERGCYIQNSDEMDAMLFEIRSAVDTEQALM